MRAMTHPHPLVAQLRFTRAEFRRGLKGVSDDDARIRLGPMNCLASSRSHHSERCRLGEAFSTIPA